MSNLVAITNLVELSLKDAANATWSTAELEQHIRDALLSVSRVDPIFTNVDIASVAATREYSLASITGFFQIIEVLYPFNSTTPQYPPNRVNWQLVKNETLFIDENDAPSGDAADKIRITYTTPHTIEDLDSATVTTLSTEGESLVVLGATAYAAMQYAQSLIGKVTVSGWTPKQLMDWATMRLEHYHRELQILANRRIMAVDSRISVGFMP